MYIVADHETNKDQILSNSKLNLLQRLVNILHKILTLWSGLKNQKISAENSGRLELQNFFNKQILMICEGIVVTFAEICKMDKNAQIFMSPLIELCLLLLTSKDLKEVCQA